MDADRFDRLTRTLTLPLSRRLTLGRLATGVLLALGLGPDETTVLAKKNGKGGGKGKGKGKGKDKKKDKKKNECRGFRPINCGDECCALEETCQGGSCRHHCQDGVQNFDETDVDCGGSCRDVRKCQFFDQCAADVDCFSSVCHPLGGVKRCGECRIDSDCDRLNNPRKFRCLSNFICAECVLHDDCPRPGQDPTQKFCRQPGFCGECAADEHCADKPGRPHCLLETDPPDPSREGKCVECRDDVDCPTGEICDAAGSCVGTTCGTFGHCCNGVKDGDETDVDCGGEAGQSGCPRCQDGQRCFTSDDCATGLACGRDPSGSFNVCQPAV